MRFADHWVTAAFWMGIMLILLIPVLHSDLAPLLIYAQLPIYMLHQVEEHSDDRFRTFVNERIFLGAEALTPAAVAVINIPAGGFALRGYNPGLWSSMTLPIGGWALNVVGSRPGVKGMHHAVGLWIAVGIHAAIGIYARAYASTRRLS